MKARAIKNYKVSEIKVIKETSIVAIFIGLIILVSNRARKSEQLLYQEAQKTLEEKKPQEAVRMYSQLIRSYPRSSNAPKAYFSLGVYILVL